MLSCICLARGTNGTPTTTYLPAQTAQVAAGLQSVEFSTSAMFGYESAVLSVLCDIEVGLSWFQQLMSGLQLWSPDAVQVWEGFLATVTLRLGDEEASISLDGMGNRVRCRYTTYLGEPFVSSTVSSAPSQLLYGIKDLVLGIGTTTGTAATNAATQKLSETAYPRMTPASTVQTGGAGEVLLTLNYLGWYEALGWVVTSDTSTTTTETTAQVGTLIADYNSTNNFFSTTTEYITASSVDDTEFIADDTPYRQKIEELLVQGDASGQRLTWGVYASRIFHVDVWVGETPSAIDYQRSAAESVVRDKAGGVVPWWEVKPNRMYQRNEYLDVNPATTQADSAGRFPIERIRCAITQGQVSLTIEGPASSSADAVIARLSN